MLAQRLFRMTDLYLDPVHKRPDTDRKDSKSASSKTKDFPKQKDKELQPVIVEEINNYNVHSCKIEDFTRK